MAKPPIRVGRVSRAPLPLFVLPVILTYAYSRLLVIGPIIVVDAHGDLFPVQLEGGVRMGVAVWSGHNDAPPIPSPLSDCSWYCETVSRTPLRRGPQM